jgi:hypothetical protein
MEKKLLTAMALAASLAVGCSDKEADSPPPEAPRVERGAKAAPDEPEAEKQAPGQVALAEASVGPLGSILLPRGYKTTQESEQGGNYSLPLSEDGFESLYVDWEASGGATTLAEGKKLVGVVIGNNATVTDESELGDGRVRFVAERESDDKIWVVVFRADAYLKCWGPREQLDNCTKIAQSLKPSS